MEDLRMKNNHRRWVWATLLQAEREGEAQQGAAARAAAAAAELESAAAGHRTEAHQLRAAIEAADQVRRRGGGSPTSRDFLSF